MTWEVFLIWLLLAQVVSFLNFSMYKTYFSHFDAVPSPQYVYSLVCWINLDLAFSSTLFLFIHWCANSCQDTKLQRHTVYPQESCSQGWALSLGFKMCLSLIICLLLAPASCSSKPSKAKNMAQWLGSSHQPGNLYTGGEGFATPHTYTHKLMQMFEPQKCYIKG